MSSVVVVAMHRYSDSVDDRETVGCFLDFHEIREWPRKIQKPEVDLRVRRHDAQSASENPLSCRLGCLG